MKSSFRFIIIAGAAALWLIDRPAFAQSVGTDRPYRGLFRGDSDTSSRHRLDLSLGAAEAYDDDLLADTGSGISSTSTPVSGFYTMFLTDVSYAWQGTHVQLAASSGSAWRYYPSESAGNGSHTAAIGLSAQFTKRTSLSVNQTAAYSPSVLVRAFPECHGACARRRGAGCTRLRDR